MKKILTSIIAAALLVSSAGCHAQQPQATRSEPEPAPQALVLNVASPTDTSDGHIDTSAIIAQIAAGLKFRPNTAEKEKENPKAYPAAEQEKAQKPKVRQENPATKPKTAVSTPTPEPPATEPDAYLKVTVKATPTPPPAATPAPTPAGPASPYTGTSGPHSRTRGAHPGAGTQL